MNLLQLIKFMFHYTVLPYFPAECSDGFISIKKKLSKVVRINFNFYGGKNQFQEDHALLRTTPNSLKPPLIGPSVMAGLHLSKLKIS